MGLMRLLEQGGVFMVPLLLMSILALAVALERMWYFASLEWGGDSFRSRLLGLLQAGHLEQAGPLLAGLRGPVASTAQTALRNWGRPRSALENSLVSNSFREQGALQRYLVVLETTVTASPLIGLLGTITGMMGVFRAVSIKLSQNPQADTSGILAGIGEALVATATGILIAVLALFLHNLFNRLAEKQMDRCQVLANDLLELHEQKTEARTEGQ